MGASDGEPRQHLDPWKQIEDYRNAISYLETRPDIDSERIGAWGISYSGGHVLILGVIDPRVKAIVSNVPVIAGYENMWRVHGTDRFRKLQALCLEDRRKRLETGVGGTLPMSGTPSGPDAELVAWPLNEVKVVFEELKRTQAPTPRALEHDRIGRAAHAVRRAAVREAAGAEAGHDDRGQSGRHHALGPRNRRCSSPSRPDERNSSSCPTPAT